MRLKLVMASFAATHDFCQRAKNEKMFEAWATCCGEARANLTCLAHQQTIVESTLDPCF